MESMQPPCFISSQSAWEAIVATSSGRSPAEAAPSAPRRIPLVVSATSDKANPGDCPDSAPL